MSETSNEQPDASEKLSIPGLADLAKIADQVKVKAPSIPGLEQIRKISDQLKAKVPKVPTVPGLENIQRIVDQTRASIMDIPLAIPKTINPIIGRQPYEMKNPPADAVSIEDLHYRVNCSEWENGLTLQISGFVYLSRESAEKNRLGDEKVVSTGDLDGRELQIKFRR